MVLVPVCDQDMGDGDVVVFEISSHIQCPLRSCLLKLVIKSGEKINGKYTKHQKSTRNVSAYLDHSQVTMI
jgi:hypothetical protein